MCWLTKGRRGVEYPFCPLTARDSQPPRRAKTGLENKGRAGVTSCCHLSCPCPRGWRKTRRAATEEVGTAGASSVQEGSGVPWLDLSVQQYVWGLMGTRLSGDGEMDESQQSLQADRITQGVSIGCDRWLETVPWMIRAGVTSSAVLLFFGISTPYSLLPSCATGLPLPARKVGRIQQVSLPCPVFVLQPACDCKWNSHAGKACWKPAPPVPTGIQPVTRCSLPNEALLLQSRLYYSRDFLEPLKVLFYEGSKEKCKGYRIFV